MTEQAVDRPGTQVIHTPALFVIQGLDMTGGLALLKQAHRDRAFVTVDEVVELATQKIAGLSGNEIQEPCLSLGVAERFQRINGIADGEIVDEIGGHRYSSKILAIMRWSSSIFAVIEARS